jgi:predicted DNA-binding transcriptional regulator YafY
MPKNKDALVRYRLINRCLIDYRYVTIDKLMEICLDTFDHEVSRRTLEKDIHDMRYDEALGYSAPISFDRFRKAYYYDDLDYSIDKIALDYNDLKALSFASALLDQYKSIGIFSTFSGAVQKIMNTMRIHRQLEKYTGKKYVGFEDFPVIEGQGYLTRLLDAILRKQVLRIEHKRFDSEEIHLHIVHPYYLKEFRNRWYLVGYQSEHKRIQTYGVERIRSLEPLDKERFIDIGFDPEEYYKHATGVIVYEDQPVDVIIRFTARQGMYILTQPIHGSQEVLENTSEWITIRVHIVPAYEFIAMILSWGDDAEVIEPVWMNERIAGILQKTLLKYGN